MAFGIDITSDCMVCSGSGDHDKVQKEYYGIVGLAPRTNEPFIWDNPLALRTSNQGPYLSLTDVWSNFMNSDPRNAHKVQGEWTNYDGTEYKESAGNLIPQAIAQNIGKSLLSKTIITIDNYLNESHQDAMLRGLQHNDFAYAELLWRPIAIALHYLDTKGRDQFKENEKLAIVDFDSYYPEITILRLSILRDELVPLRDLPPENSPIGKEYSCYNLKREFIKTISDDIDEKKQLLCGPFSGDFFSFLVGKKHGDIFIRKDLSYSRFQLDSKWPKEIADHDVGGKNFKSLRKQILDMEDYISADHKIWHGFPCILQDPDIFSDTENVLDSKAVAKGAADYAQRRIDGRPTYLDTLPGLEIFSKVESGGNTFTTVIEKDEVEGGQKKTIDEPLKQFKLEKDADKFESVLRDESSEKAKILRTSIPPNKYEVNVPLILDAEMMPANGHAVVTIEGDSEHRDVFGSLRRIKLDWKTMDKYEIQDPYSGPEVYPVRGRIADDPECREIVKEISNKLEGGESINFTSYQVTYQDRSLAYKILHGPWGYFSPWKEPLGEPMRAMFGANQEHDNEIDHLASVMSKIIYKTVRSTKDQHKYLNYMFRYAPETFLDELRNLYSSNNPDLNWNTVFGVGRTFYKKDDFELFVDFFLKKSESTGYPAYPDEAYTDKYFWAFFRCLCYYDETNLIPIEKAENVLKCISNYSKGRRPRGNTVKFILSAILFSLRFRTGGRIFVPTDSELFLEMKDVIYERLPQIPCPPAMFDTSAMFGTDHLGTLNDFVYRFLAEEQTSRDLEALQGLVTSMS